MHFAPSVPRRRGLCLKTELLVLLVSMLPIVELRGDVTARGAWSKAMREVGAYSADDIRALEDLPELGHDKGGDIYYGNKNYAPLDEFRSISGGNGGEQQ